MVCYPQQQNTSICGLVTVVCELPARVLQISSDKVDSRILLGFEFLIPEFF